MATEGVPKLGVKRPRSERARRTTPLTIWPSLVATSITAYTRPRREASMGVRRVVEQELENDRGVGRDVYQPKDARASDPVIREAHLPSLTSSGSGEESEEEGEPEEDILAPLPEEREALAQRAASGDKGAIEELEALDKLEEGGGLVAYGATYISSDDEFEDDEEFDLIEEGDRPANALALGQEGAIRQLRPEPLELDEAIEDGLGNPTGDMEARALHAGYPRIDEYVPLDQWHPLRFVFDIERRLVLPPGRAHSMYAFVTAARTSVVQLDMNSEEVDDFVIYKEVGRNVIDFDGLLDVYHVWDPRLQKLFSSTAPTETSRRLGEIKKWWRGRLRHTRREIHLRDIHEKARELRILNGRHPQDGMRENFVWIDNVPATVEPEPLALPAPPPGPPPSYEELALECERLRTDNARLRSQLLTVLGQR